jgi:N-acetylmuramoyl-L-alanine amidase
MFLRVGRAVGKGRTGAVLASALGVACLAAVAVSHAATSSISLLKVRLGGDAAQTRIVIDLDHAASAKVVSDGAADHRVVIVLPGVSTQGAQGGGQGLVKTWLLDDASGGARLQMDVAAGVTVKRRFLLPPADGVDHYRYVVDLTSDGAPPVQLTAAATPAPVLKLRGQIAPARPAPLSLKKVIVIDAGHGGHDPGAHGEKGFEKDINLAAAQTLKARLERSGRYKVVMTRESDVYVPLEDRVRVAQRADADLFISLHSDSGPETDLSGASVYTLSDKGTARSRQFVTKDDWYMKASLTRDTGVRDILLDLTQRATRNRSGLFAETLVSRIEGRAPLLRRSHRDAGFMVLLAPNVPAVLLEMGFVSNRQDEQFLRDPQRRSRLMNAVGDSIDDYFAEDTRLAAR